MTDSPWGRERLPLEHTTPMTEVIEATTERVTESMRSLSPLAERAVSDLVRPHAPDTSLATTTYNAARLWIEMLKQGSLMAERLAGNIQLLSLGNVQPAVFFSLAPLPQPTALGLTPGTRYTIRPGALTCSNGTIDARRVRFVRPDGSEITPANPLVYAAGTFLDVRVRIDARELIPFGPIRGQVEYVAEPPGSTVHPLDVSFAVG